MSLSEWPSISYTSGYTHTTHISYHVTFMEEREVALQQKAFKLPGRNQVRYTSFRITFLNIISLIIIVVDQCGTQHMRTLEAT